MKFFMCILTTVQTGLYKGSNAVDANVKIVRGYVSDVSNEKRQTLTALYQAARVVRT